MKRVTSLIAAFLLTLLIGVIAMAQDGGGKPVLGIKAFENPPNYYHSTIGTGMSDLFTTELMKTNKYKIVEREALGDLANEVDLGKSGYGDKATATPKGHFKGLEYLFVCKVTNFGEKERKVGTGGIGGRVFGGLGTRQSAAYVRLDFRIVDATTREVVYAGSGEGEDKTTGVSLDGGAFGKGAGAVDFSDRSFLDSQVGRATMKAIGDVIQKMDHNFLSSRTSGSGQIKAQEAAARETAEAAASQAPGKILAVISNQLIILNLGSSTGLKLGDKLKVFKEQSITDSKGKVVYTEEKEVGLIVVTEVQADRSKAAIVSGSGFSEGLVVRRQ
ncbi:MAG TPA: CsgG/HfaB family protein [Blastocatellia bacterium]|nr:CsgG/HfaB family protein [Blastocatellia bacterium]